MTATDVRDLAPLAAAAGLLIGGGERLAQAGVTEGTALLSAGLVTLGFWLADRRKDDGEE